MSLIAPRRPLLIALAALVGWAIFTILAVMVEGLGFWWDVLGAAFRALASVFAVLALGGGLLEIWQRREWRSRTQWVAVDLIDRAMRQLATVAAAARAMTPVPGARDEPLNLLSDLFSLPWSPIKAQALAREARTHAHAALASVMRGWHSTDARPESAPSTDRLMESVDKLWDIARDLSGYLDDRRGPEVLTQVSQLHSKVRLAANPFPGEEITGDAAAALAGMGMGEVFEALAPVAEAIDAARVATARHVTVPALREVMARAEEEGRESDRTIEEWERETIRFQKVLENADRVSQQFAEAGDALLGELAALIKTPDLDEEKLALVRDTLAEAKRITDPLHEQLLAQRTPLPPDDPTGS